MPSQIKSSTLEKEKMEAAIGNYMVTAIIVLLGSVLYYAIIYQYNDTNKYHLNLWLLCQCCLCFGYVFIYIRYHNNYQTIEKYWANGIEVPLSMAAGLSWGLFWVLFINPNDLSSVIFLNALISSVLMIYVIATPLHPLASNARTLSCMTPVMIKSYSIGTPLFDWFCIGAALLTLATLLFSRQQHHLYLNMMLQRDENHQLTKALETERNQVEKISQEKTRFLASASHDLRQPIQAIELFVAALFTASMEPNQKEILAKIHESCHSLSNVLEPLLDISKLDSGIIKTYPEQIHVDDLFYQIQQQFTELAAKKHIQLHCVYTSQQVYVDPKILERILSNLVMNAITHMQRAGKILLGIRRHGKGLRIEIWDNGQGIPEAEQEKVFDEFYQISNPERNSSNGIGLGLSIVKRLSQLMGCQLYLQSTFGKGCCFAIIFPPDSLSILKKHTKTVTNDAITTNVTFSQAYNILIVEDDSNVAESLRTLLSSWGLKCQLAQNITTAVATLSIQQPDFILSDYQLKSGQTGLEVIAAVQQQLNHNIPALLLTGNTDSAYLKTFKGLGLTVLNKPVQAAKLKMHMIDLLQGKAPREFE